MPAGIQNNEVVLIAYGFQSLAQADSRRSTSINSTVAPMR